MRHHGGISPAWPISYDDLEPYYTQAERLYQVHGERGEDPTEPPAQLRRIPCRPSATSRASSSCATISRAAGLRPFHVPVGVHARREESAHEQLHPLQHLRRLPLPGPREVRCAGDVRRPALKHPNVTLMTNALVERLETDSSGREVTSVVVEPTATLETYSADIVVVSCGAINSAALLLRSANDRHPGGLANSSDVVGRHYMGHTNSVLMAISKCPNPTIFQKTLGVNDFYFGSKDWEYPMGHISFVGKLDAITLRAGAPAIAPGFTLDLMAKHSLDFWLTSEDLPDPDNRVTLDRDGKIVLTLHAQQPGGARAASGQAEAAP